MVHGVFKDISGPSTNAEGMNSLADDVSNMLIGLDIGPDELKQIMKNMKSADDRTALLMGGASALGFIGGGHAWTSMAPMLKTRLPFGVLPYLPGALTGVVDRLLSSVLADIHPGYYASPDPAMLEDAMLDCLAHHQRSLLKELIDQAGALSTPYTIRNVIDSISAPFAAHFGQTELVGKGINGIGGIGAGAWVQGLRNANDLQDGVGHHPAYFLGRKDLKLQLKELRAPLHRKITRAINQTCKGSANIPDILFDACKRLLTIESMTEISLLALGFACNDWLKGAAEEEFNDASLEASAFIKNTTGTVFLAGLYCSLSVAMTGASKLKQRLVNRTSK